MSFLRNWVSARIRDKVLFYHVLGWALFILYEVSFVTLLIGVPTGRNVLFDYVLPYIVNISLFYYHAHVTLSYSFGKYKRKYALFIILLVGGLCLYLYLMTAIDILDQDRSSSALNQFLSGNTTPLLRHLWRGIYFTGFSSAYWFVIKSIIAEKRIRHLEKLQMQHQIDKSNLEKGYIEMQNAYLQSQINPHLIFNTLNFIYNNVQQVSEKASDAVLLLAELMNYSLRELEPDGKVNLEKEIEQIRNIIKINQIRFNNKLYLDVEFNGDFSDARIIPMGLLPLIENVFKHANLTDKEYPGKITINYNGEYVEVVTLNKKKTRTKIFSHGIGLVNMHKRLNNLYKDAYTFTINNGDDDFYLHLVIKL